MSATSPRFGLHAERYQRYRPRYGPELYQLIEARSPGRRDLAVDLGAGTGQVTIDLLGRFARVVAVEPDPDMAARIAPDPRLAVQVCAAEEADVAEGAADAVVAGTAFHWMDAARVSANAKRWLRSGGVFCVFVYPEFSAMEPEAVRDRLAAEGAKWAACKDERLKTWTPYVDAVRATGVFAAVEAIRVPHVWRAPAAEIAGFYLSTSFASAYARATGDAGAYAREFARALEDAAGGEEVTVRYDVEGALAVA